MTAYPPGRALVGLPGVRAQVDEIAAGLAAGLNCLWLLPDQLVETGQAEELYRAALTTTPDRLDVAPPTVLTVPAQRGPARGGPAGAPGQDHWDDPGHRAGAADADHDTYYAADDADDADEGWGDLPALDFDDDFDLGWSDARPARPARPAVREQAVPELFERLGKELAVEPGEVVTRLTDPARRWRPVIGLRAWTEPDEPGPAVPGPRGGAVRGGAVQRLFHALSAAVKDAGLPPQARPRLLVVARLRDVPQALTDELERDIATTAVHWWWGTVGRLDTATVVARARERGPGTTVTQRVLTAVREEVVTELAAFDLALAERLAAHWDGRAGGLGPALRSCLDDSLVAAAGLCPEAALDAGTRRRPGSRLRPAWARGLVQSWEGRLRRHPAVWYAATATPAEVDVLLGQAQQRVVSPWIEDARAQLARLGTRYATRPLADLVAAHAARPPADHRTRPEAAFAQLEVGALLGAHLAGGLALPEEELRLLRELVTARNVLAHRGALRDTTLHALCEQLTLAHRRWAKL